MNARTRILPLALVFVSLLLASCADKAVVPPPPQAAAPAPLPAQDWGRPLFHYATNRNVLDAATGNARYGGVRSREMSYGELRFSATGGAADGADLYRVNVSLDRVTRQTQARFLADIERAAARTPGREVLLFIHGFDNTFEDAAKAGARIGVGIGFTGAMVFYSWPSAGSPTAYLADRNNAYWAVHGLKELLASLTASPWVGRVSVVVHSMGNEVFIRAYGELAGECAGGAARGECADLRKVRAIVLAAPDMDREIFLDQYAARLSSLGARVALYASRADMALAASALVQGGDYERLGKNVLCIPGMHVTDVSDVKTDLFGHSWISQSRSVLQDLRCTLAEGCNRYAAGLLQEMVCPSSLRYALPGVDAGDNRATSGVSYWRLVVPQAGTPAPPPASAFGVKLPSFLSN